MARTELTVTDLVGPYPSLQPAANSLDVTFAAADVVNGNYFDASGEDILLMWNDGGASPFYVTISSVIDEKNRTGDITEYDVGIDEIAAFKLKNLGWRQTDGGIYVDAEDVAIKLAILKL